MSVLALAASLGLLAGCSGDPSVPSGDETSAGDSPSASGEASNGQGCSVILFDSDDLDESDDHFELTEPGRYDDLSELPGAGQDWTDEADSIKVGEGTSATIWSERGFTGESETLEPGSEHPNLGYEPSSLEMTC